VLQGHQTISVMQIQRIWVRERLNPTFWSYLK